LWKNNESAHEHGRPSGAEDRDQTKEERYGHEDEAMDVDSLICYVWSLLPCTCLMRAMPGVMNTRLNIVVGTVLVLAGCAHFGHQTSLSEAHAVLRFGADKDAPLDQPKVKRLDGLPVSAGRSYRVKPGKHELVCLLDRVLIVGGPTDIDILKTTGTIRAGLHMPGDRSSIHQHEYITNLFTVEAGCIYSVEGESVSKAILEGGS
jgi:hypothetical protein